MAIDPFLSEIVALVRRMSDEAILALVRNQLEQVAELSGKGHARAASIGGTKERAGARKPTGRRQVRKRIDSTERAQLLETIERIVQNSSGLSASEIASTAGAQKARVASTLKELKLSKRIFQGGDRRFARYAGDAKTAAASSEQARRTASGPLRAGKPSSKAKKKSAKG